MKLKPNLKASFIFSNKTFNPLPGTDIGPILIPGIPGMPILLGPIIGDVTLQIKNSLRLLILCFCLK